VTHPSLVESNPWHEMVTSAIAHTATSPVGDAAVRRRRTRPPALFCGFWTTLEGRRLGRASRQEIATAYRLWREHADIRQERA
jgi:hypothetical protein